MIFVVLGTQKFQLNRLLMQLDEEIEKGLIRDEVYAQIGNSDYEPKHFGYEKFMDKADFEAKIKNADLIIAHSGVGTIMTAINSGRPVIVYPQLAKYREHVDNHQLDIANAFAKNRYVLCYKENELLSDTIEQCRNFSFEKYVSHRENIVNVIEDFIQSH